MTEHGNELPPPLNLKLRQGKLNLSGLPVAFDLMLANLNIQVIFSAAGICKPERSAVTTSWMSPLGHDCASQRRQLHNLRPLRTFYDATLPLHGSMEGYVTSWLSSVREI